ncbi:XamI family restriction endonuclease [Mycobacterium avium]|uniref:XamI family restriction endonuclease n=1 Tax=Mycobacterium avium TaxID=1764 RepID=UPI003F7618CC
MGQISDVGQLTQLCIALGAGTIGELSEPERKLVASHSPPQVNEKTVAWTYSHIKRGIDPLGAAYATLLSPQQRRPLGQTYTPPAIVEAMTAWAADQGTPTRIVDPGAGSGRYLVAAAKRFPKASVTAAEIDPLSALMLRANISVAGLADRATVHLGDYRALQLPRIDGPTLFIGNPPYVRHHKIDPTWKQWLIDTAKSRGFKASGLAGLHVHFFLATAQLAKPGDFGAFITSSEWMDVNYGSLVRQLLLDGLGGESIHVLDPKAAPFADAATTGAITCFKIGTAPSSMKLRRVDTVTDLGHLTKGRKVSRQRLAESSRWSVLTRVTPKLPSGWSKKDQEDQVAEYLITQGLTEVATRTIKSFNELPLHGEFCRESLFGERKADLIVRLWDGRAMPIECKVSNSSTNSVKRLNNDAAAKAVKWINDFGTLNVVPTAVLSGVYKVHNLESAQQAGLTIIWAHNLGALGSFLEATKSK